jgi:proteasome assembly chaperone (PAC2) family protein
VRIYKPDLKDLVFCLDDCQVHVAEHVLYADRVLPPDPTAIVLVNEFQFEDIGARVILL